MNNHIEQNESVSDSDMDGDLSEDSSGLEDENEPQEKKEKHTKSWEETNESELWVFFAIQIYMGMVRVSDTKDYWSK